MCPLVKTSDGFRLHVTDTGSGAPVVFLHEFCADHRSWSGQVAALRDEFRCITYDARGYPPSDVPTSPSSYSWQHAVDDAIAVLDAVGIASAHLVGLSMGGYTAVQLGLRHPDRVRSIMAVSVGSGSDLAVRSAYLAETRTLAEQLRSEVPEIVGRRMANGPSRVQLRRNNEPAWHEMIERFSELSAEGLAHTIVCVQGTRPPLHDFFDELSTLSVPLLVVDGDEDEACLPTGLILKRTAPSCGLRVLPHTGHSPNLEDPKDFNELTRRFLRRVDSSGWPQRDSRSRAVLQLSDVDVDASDESA